MKLLRLFVVTLAIAVPAAPAAAQPIKLGELNSYKVFPAFLEPYRKGMELAVDEINASGGVLGRKLELVSRDDNGNPGDAVRVAEELISREEAPSDATLAEFSRLLSEEVRPITDHRGTEAYRRHASGVLARRLLERCLAA